MGSQRGFKILLNGILRLLPLLIQIYKDCTSGKQSQRSMHSAQQGTGNTHSLSWCPALLPAPGTA